MTGIEPVTSSLPRKRSTPELHRLRVLSGRRGSNPRPTAWKAVALPTELRPQNIQQFAVITLPCLLIFFFKIIFESHIFQNSKSSNKLWGEKDSNLRRRTPMDLQSIPVDRFGIPPKLCSIQYLKKRPFTKSKFGFCKGNAKLYSFFF